MKIKYACGCVLLAVLCALLLPLPVRAGGDVLEWVEIGKPGSRGNIVVSPSEVSKIAVGRGSTIYALDSVNSKLYQSLNAGATWEDITFRLFGAGAGSPFSQIAMAPDTTGTVAVVTNSGTAAYFSNDSSNTWNDAHVPSLTGVIQVITISRQYTEGNQSLRDVAIGTAEWGNSTTTGDVWVFQLGKASASWRKQNLTVDPGHVGGEVSAIAYSPSYQRDNTIAVVASTGSDVAASYQNRTWLCLGKRDTGAGSTAWDAFSAYPVEIATSSSPSLGDDVGVTISSSLALPSNYSSSDEDLRQLFVSYDRQPNASDDVYRLEDTDVYRLNANNGSPINISSLAYSGTTTSGKLLAGEVNPVAGTPNVQVRRTTNPFALTPTWNSAAAPPSGPGGAQVSWNSSGDLAYCGTSQSPGAAQDESAFSVSSDDGDNWQQLSLIDTTVKISDVAPAPDSQTLFVATYSTLGPEGIWRSAATETGIGWYWSRQLTMDTVSQRVIIRLSPGYASDYTLYAAESGGTLIAVSHNRGNSWKKHRTPDGVIDIVVEDETTVYAALPGGFIRKSRNNGFTWDRPVSTGVADINMLALGGKGMVLVGGRGGEVSYSTDGGGSFTRINELVGTGDVQVIADINYPENGIIYAATSAPDSGIWRWTVGRSTLWEQIDESVTALNTGQRIDGLTMGSAGALYALRMEPASTTAGGMTRFLSPAAPGDIEIELDFVNYALPAGTTFDPTLLFTNTMPYLKISEQAAQNDLWALDTSDPANQIIYRFQDALAAKSPTLITPADRFENKISAITGRSADIAFGWSRPAENAIGYEVGIYTDAAAASRVQLCPVSSISDKPSVLMGPGQSSTTNQFVGYLAGTTYYWRVRSTDPVRSPWSEVNSFTVEAVAALVPGLLLPADGSIGISRTPAFSWSPVSGTVKYQLVLADNVNLTSPIADINVTTPAYAVTNALESGKTYFWAVRAVTPIESSWSGIARFTVKEKPAELMPPVVVDEVPPRVINIPALPPSPAIILPPPPPASPPTAPAYIWAIIIIFVVLIVAVVALIVRTGRRV